jgi:transposase
MAWRVVRGKQWQVIEAQLPKRRPDTRGGRPPLSDRQCFEGILWRLWTGTPWSEVAENDQEMIATVAPLNSRGQVPLLMRCRGSKAYGSNSS